MHGISLPGNPGGHTPDRPGRQAEGAHGYIVLKPGSLQAKDTAFRQAQQRTGILQSYLCGGFVRLDDGPPFQFETDEGLRFGAVGRNNADFEGIIQVFENAQVTFLGVRNGGNS